MHSVGSNIKLLLRYYALEPEKLKPLKSAKAAKMICDRIYQRPQEEWDTLPHNTPHNIKPKLEYWHTTSRRIRSEEVALARLRMGHTNLSHSYILSHTTKPICPYCHTHVFLSLSHIISECYAFDHYRYKFFSKNVIKAFEYLVNDRFKNTLLLNFLNPPEAIPTVWQTG